MVKQRDIWQNIEIEQNRYNCLRLSDMFDYDKHYLYSIIAHSTAIEGSTLSERDTQLLFDESMTRKGNIIEYLMSIDLKSAYTYAIDKAKAKTAVTPDLLKTMSALVMKNTGSIMNVAAGSFDATKGEYRLCGVSAGIGGRSYMSYQKVSERVEKLCDKINDRIPTLSDIKDFYNLSFDAHFNLATIHPWIDGNGRVARLLMNYIQFYYNITPTKVFKDDRGDYINSLQQGQEQESIAPFREFMAMQHLKNLKAEIKNYEQSKKRSDGFQLMF